MIRGDIVLVAVAGDFGKPRPAVVIQSDTLPQVHPTVIVSLITSDVGELALVRMSVSPSLANGLRAQSDIMIDKIFTVPRAKVRGPIGRLSVAELSVLDTRLAAVLGLVQPHP